MNAYTVISLEALHQAIVADIQAAFPQFQTVEFYRETDDQAVGRKLPPMPALLLELDEFEPAPDRDPGTGQLAVHAKFEARVVVGFRTPKAKIAVRTLAAGLAGWLEKRRWQDPANPGKTLATGPAQGIGAYADHFDPHLDQCDVFRVEWLQVIHLGTPAVWDEGAPPSQVLFNWAPEVGTPFEGEYVQLVPQP